MRPGSGCQASTDHAGRAVARTNSRLMRGLGIKINWAGSRCRRGDLCVWWLAVDGCDQPGVLDSSWRRAAVSVPTSGAWAGSDSTVSHRAPAYDSAAKVTGTLPAVLAMGITARSGVPAKVSGCAGPRRLVAKVWTSRWRVTNQQI